MSRRPVLHHNRILGKTPLVKPSRGPELLFSKISDLWEATIGKLPKSLLTVTLLVAMLPALFYFLSIDYLPNVEWVVLAQVGVLSSTFFAGLVFFLYLALIIPALMWKDSIAGLEVEQGEPLASRRERIRATTSGFLVKFRSLPAKLMSLPSKLRELFNQACKWLGLLEKTKEETAQRPRPPLRPIDLKRPEDRQLVNQTYVWILMPLPASIAVMWLVATESSWYSQRLLAFTWTGITALTLLAFRFSKSPSGLSWGQLKQLLTGLSSVFWAAGVSQTLTLLMVVIASPSSRSEFLGWILLALLIGSMGAGELTFETSTLVKLRLVILIAVLFIASASGLMMKAVEGVFSKTGMGSFTATIVFQSEAKATFKGLGLPCEVRSASIPMPPTAVPPQATADTCVKELEVLSNIGSELWLQSGERRFSMPRDSILSISRVAPARPSQNP